MDRAQLLNEAAAIVEQLRDHSIRTRDGKVIWRGPTGYGTELTPLRMVKLGPYLGDGYLGVAVFLAAFERVCGGGECGKLALRVLEPLRQELAELAADAEKARQIRFPVGGFVGLGSLIYGFAKVGELLGERDLLREAHLISGLIDQERIDDDQSPRIQKGCAGAILALLALGDEISIPNQEGRSPLEVALACARHLLKVRVSFEGRPRAWPLSVGKPPLAGFAYGAAGVSYSLLRLHEVVAEQDLWDAAQEGLSFVRSLYCPEHGSWRDVRLLFQSRYSPRRGTWGDWWVSGAPSDLIELCPPSVPQSEFPESWCHGAVGIVLGQIGSLHICGTPEGQAEIDRTLRRVRSYASGGEDLDGSDDICSGHMGMIELLLSAHQRMGDVRSLEAAFTLMERVGQRKRSKGRYEFLATCGQDLFAPSFIQGVSGIGYTLLRLAAPESLPCLLLFD
ncbi:MAG TPA: lanthionine synthetase LanC family protein [Thermoanaerobaculia bacterium]